MADPIHSALPPFEDTGIEGAFQAWYAKKAATTGTNPNPDDPQHFYDYRRAFLAGEEVDAEGHMASRWKLPGHPHLIVDGMDTRTGQPAEAAPTGQEPGFVGSGRASGVPGWGPEAQPRFAIEDDLEAASPDFWQEMDAAFQKGYLTPDDFVTLQRQRVHDWEDPLLQESRVATAKRTAKAQAEDAARAQQAEDEEQTIGLGGGDTAQVRMGGRAPEVSLQITKRGPPELEAPPTAGPSTAQQASAVLSKIGLRGIQPLEPATTVVDMMYAGVPDKEKNPVYVTARRLAVMADLGLTAINVPVTGVGDLGALVFAPITMGLRAAGFSDQDVESFVAGARFVPELVAGLEMGMPRTGAIGKLVTIGNLKGAPKEVQQLAREVAGLGRYFRLNEAGLLETKVVTAAGKPVRVYHGTSATFESFDPARADKVSLYGPGFYFTEDPSVAGGYAEPRASREYTKVRFTTLAEAEAFAKTKDAPGDDALVGSASVGDKPWVVSYRHQTDAPQVRPAYLDIRKPFDIEAQAANVGEQVATLQKLAEAAESVGAGRAAIELRQHADFIGGGKQGGSYRPDVKATDPPWMPQTMGATGMRSEQYGQWLYDELVRTAGGKVEANQILQAAGYDGITHTGGAISGTKPHRVWIAFHPEQVVDPFELESTTNLSKVLMNEIGGVRGPKVKPDARQITRLFQRGQELGGATWYHGFGDTLRKLYGDEVADKAAGVIAAVSPLRPAGALSKKGKFLSNSNLEIFRRVWEVYENAGGGETGIAAVEKAIGPKRQIGMMKSSKENVLRALRSEQLGGIDALKIQNFKQALLGDKHAIVLDSWMKRIFYPKDYALAWVKDEDGDFVLDAAGAKVPEIDKKTGKQKIEFNGGFSPAQYRATADIIKRFSDKHGVPPSDVQAALWVAKKYLVEGAEKSAAGNLPFRDTLRRVFEHSGYDLGAFDDAGKSEMGVTFMLAHALLGGAVGGAQGDTPEEKVRNALIGAGLGAMISPATLKLGTKAVTELRGLLSPELTNPALQATRAAAGQPPPVAAAVVPHNPATLAQQYADAVVTARRGGPRPHELVQQEAQALIDQGLVSMDTVKAIVPGTALNDAHAVAVVKTLADSGIRVKALATRALQTGDPADVQAAMQELYLHGQVDPKRIGVGTESGRALSAMNDPTSGMNRFLIQFEELLRDQTLGVDPMVVLKSISEFQNPDQLAIIARQASKPGFWEMWKEYYVNGLLWNPKTWVANGVGNTATTLWAIPERQAAAWLGAVRGGGGVVQGEAWALMHGMLGSVHDAWRLAAKAFREGESQFSTMAEQLGEMPRRGADKLELKHPRAISSETFDKTGIPGAAIDWIGNVVRFPSRVLSGTDDFFKVVNYRGELRAQALRQATQDVADKGLTGKAYANAVNTRMAQILADPPLSVKRAADRFALYQTFTNELGETGEMIQQLAQTPGGKLVLPFVRTPLNITKYATDRTPLGLLKKSIWKDLNGTDLAKRDLAMAKLSLGSLTLGLAGVMAYEGLVTGAGPSDPKMQAQLRAQGWMPYSIKLGGTYYQYSRTEPVGMLLALGARWQEAVANAEGDDWLEWGVDAATDATVAVFQHLSDRTFVKGLAETMAAIADPERAADVRASSLIISQLPMSGAIRQAETILDPTIAEANSTMDRVWAQIPGLSSRLPPRRDLWGNPVYMTGVYGPIAISPLKDDPVLKELVAVRAHITDLPRKVEESIALTGQERDDWAVLRGTMKNDDGQTMKQALAAMMNSGEYRKDFSEERKAFELELIIGQFTQDAKIQITDDKYPEIRRSILKAKDDRINKREGPPTKRPDTPLLRSLTR